MTGKTRALCLFIVIGIIFSCGIFLLKDKIIILFETLFAEKVYQIEFSEEVEKASEEFGVPVETIYAVIKTESNFKKDAVSRVGAVGLMQLMPETFSWIASRLGEEMDESMISDPLVNIRYGTYYLSFLIERLYNEEAVFAAYNAGYSRVKGWLADSRYSADGKKLDLIPYDETSEYVKRVSGAKKKYSELLSKA